MKNLLPHLVLAGALAVAVPSTGCNGSLDATVDIHATVHVTTTIDVAHVTVGEAIPMTVVVTNVFLVDPAATPPTGDTTDAGHLQVYLDDTSSTPLLITASASFSVTVPAATSMGSHKIVCRVHRHDGTATTTSFELNFTVTATASG